MCGKCRNEEKNFHYEYYLKNYKNNLGMVTHAVIPALKWPRQKDHQEFKASLGYTVQGYSELQNKSFLQKQNKTNKKR